MKENNKEIRQELSDDDLDEVSGGVYTLEKDCAIKCSQCMGYYKIEANTAIPSQCPRCGSSELIFVGSH